MAEGGWAFERTQRVRGERARALEEPLVSVRLTALVTQRVEASVVAHWALNALHFFLFTYSTLAW